MRFKVSGTVTVYVVLEMRTCGEYGMVSMKNEGMVMKHSNQNLGNSEQVFTNITCQTKSHTKLKFELCSYQSQNISIIIIKWNGYYPKKISIYIVN